LADAAHWALSSEPCDSAGAAGNTRLRHNRA
jgi:hypothetical protein